MVCSISQLGFVRQTGQAHCKVHVMRDQAETNNAKEDRSRNPAIEDDYSENRQSGDVILMRLAQHVSAKKRSADCCTNEDW